MRLQGIYRELPAKAVKDLKIGDIMTWNFGYKSQVVDLKPSKSGKSYEISEKDLQDGIVRIRRKKATTLVVVE